MLQLQETESENEQLVKENLDKQIEMNKLTKLNSELTQKVGFIIRNCNDILRLTKGSLLSP